MDHVRRHSSRPAPECRADGWSLSGGLNNELADRPVTASRPWHGNLATVVEREIIPRLMLVHSGRPVSAPRVARKPTEVEIALFASLLLSPADQEAERRIGAMVDDGLALESLLLDLLAPSARYLGELWEEDACDFTELTIAMGRLQRILHDVSIRFGESESPGFPERRILLGPCPGETHLFGLSMLERFFRDAGWAVTSATLEVAADMIASARTHRFDVIGLSLNCEVLLPALAETVRAMRAASLNRDVCILVGGSIFVENPRYASLVGADATAPDGLRAVLAAESLLDLRAVAC